jgi:hypothetical protein
MLRLQKKGNPKNPWSTEDLKDGLTHFYQKHGHYPTATEFDAYPYLPSSRQIERRFGGLVALRQQLKLDAQTDLRTGQHSSNRAYKINQRAHKLENEVYGFLTKMFGKEFVHREYFFVDDKRTRADFFVYDRNNGFCVDIFYPSNRRNMSGCLNAKLDKYRSEHMQQYPVIFLQMNKDINQETLDKLVRNKIKVLNKSQSLMGWDTFCNFCQKRGQLTIT